MINIKLISPRYADLRDFLLALPAKMETEGECVYSGKRNLIKRFTAPDGESLIVKRFHRPRFVNKFVYSWGIRKPKGMRAFTYASVLREHGVETPEPIAYIEDRDWGILKESWLITPEIPYKHLLYEMGDAEPEVYEPMAKALAAFTAHMHDEGVLHKDYSPGNILWDKDVNGNTCFSIVDINRMYFGPVDIKQGCANFARLWGPKRFIEILVAEYARLRKFDEQEAIGIAMYSRRKFWTRYRKRHKVKFKLEL